MPPTSGRKKRTGKTSPPTDPDPPSQSGHKRSKRGPDATSSTQRRPPAASKPLQPVAPHTSASQPSLSADSIQYVTTSMSSLSMDAWVRPQGDRGLGYDEYGPIAGPIPSTWQDDRYGQHGSISYDPHAQSFQQQQYSSGQYGQFGTNPYDPNAQHNPYPSQVVNPYQDPHFPQAMEMRTANPAPIGHQLDTGDPARSGYGTKHRREHPSDKSKHVEPQREARGTGWSSKEDNALGRIKKRFDRVGQGEEWKRIAQQMEKANYSRSADECQARWNDHINAVPIVPSPLWSDAEVAKLLELMTVPPNFKAISENIPGRSVQACADKYYDLLDEEEKARKG